MSDEAASSSTLLLISRVLTGLAALFTIVGLLGTCVGGALVTLVFLMISAGLSGLALVVGAPPALAAWRDGGAPAVLPVYGPPVFVAALNAVLAAALTIIITLVVGLLVGNL